MRPLNVALCALSATAGCGRFAFDAATDAADTVDASTLPTGTVALQEAEAGILVSPFVVRSDPEASGGSFVIDDFFESGRRSTGQVTHQMSIPTGGDYLIWARARAPDTSSDSFFIAVDGGPRIEFDTAIPNMSDPSWHWIPVPDATAPYPPHHFQLVAGPHTIVLSSRETLSTLDQLAIARAP